MSNAQTNPAPAQIPVTILTGYLGSGKTTLINHILNAPRVSASQSLKTNLARKGLIMSCWFRTAMNRLLR